MDRQQILLAKSLEAAQVPQRVDSFNERLILQKSVYLLQEAGIHLGFRFRWYIRGPYSPDMTAAVFGIINEGEYVAKTLQQWKLDDTSAKRAIGLRSLLCRAGESQVEKARRLELLASVLFLFRTNQAKPSDPKGTSVILRNNNKDFDINRVKDAVRELTKHGFLGA